MFLNKQQCLILGNVVLILTIKSTFGKITAQRYVEDVGDDIVESVEDYHGNDGDVNKRISDSTDGHDVKGLGTIASRHPLDPLNAFEMRLAASMIRLYNNSAPWQFKFIGLREPDKTLMYPYFLTQTEPPHGTIRRKANVLLTDPIIRRPIWAIVCLTMLKVESWEEAGPGEKVAAITVEDNDLAVQLVLANPDVLKRIQALGYNGISDVVPDVWDAGYVADNPNYAQAMKLVQVYFYGIRGTGENFYAHPFDFVVYVELGVNIIRGIENLPIQQNFDTRDRTGNSVPTTEYNYFPELLPPNTIRNDLHRLKISQPDGPSFKIDGREISWQNFKLRVGYNPREGGHIYTVTFNDHGEIRPIAYRMSLSEIYLQYGDPRPPYHRKSSFDESNGELGTSTRALPVHQFCRGDPYYFEADHHNEKAETWVTQNSICVVEEDDGILWAHYDSGSGKTAAVRNQRLSVSFLTTFGNTDYWISWRFYQDATIEVAIKVTGVLSTNLLAVDVKSPPYGTLVAPQVYSEIYQHFFAVRIDVDIDGMDNTVTVDDIVRVSETVSPDNPYGNGLKFNSTVLKTAGQSPSDTLVTRTWKITNPNTVQYLSGTPKGYRLVPQGASPTLPNLLTPDSPIRSRIPWADHNMWVTTYDPDQIFIGGKYLSDGVAAWIQQNSSANIENTDVILWHVFSIVHAPEIEDWPVLSTCPGFANFRLTPSGFFNENPAVYSPPASETTALDGRDNDTVGWRAPVTGT